MSAPLVEVHADADALATAVAGALLSRLAEAQAAGRTPHVCLTGGTIAEAVHHEVGRLSVSAGVDWGQVGVWWGDERFVAADSPDRNDLQAQSAFLDAVGAAQVHPMPSTDTAPDVAAAAASYAREVRASGAGEFEVLMLGLGPDGHVASLFPGHPALADDGIAVAVTDSPKPPPERVSLTLAALEHARSVWVIASGTSKADAVAAALAEQGSVIDTPARGVAGRVDTVYFLDRDAASAL